MGGNAFHIVDVFAERRYAGNQLAVVEDAGTMSADRMQAIAREFDYSETTFIESDERRDGGYDVRIFTPEEEIPFAGHPTLGTAFVIREAVADDPTDEVVLNLGVGGIPVRVESRGGRELFWMTQRPPTFGRRFDHDALAPVLGLDPAALDREWPVETVSTGLPTVVVPLADREALEGISLDNAAYDGFVAGHDAKCILAFCPDARDGANDMAVRMFAPGYGVPEDPATGSSNGCLAGYLVHHRYFDADAVDLRVEQGYEMGRPSLLHLRADATDDEVRVTVGGSVVPVAHGELV